MRRFIGAVVLAAIACLILRPVARAAPPRLARDPAGWVSVPVPDGWNVGSDSNSVRLTSGPYWVAVIDGPPARPAAATAALAEQIRRNYRDFTEIKSGRPTIAGAPSVYATFRAVKADGQAFAMMTAGIQAPGGRVLLFVSSAPFARIDDASPHFVGILNGIRFAAQVGPAPGAGAAGAFQSIDNPGGGRIVVAGLGRGAAPAAAMAALLRHVHALFAARPIVTDSAENRASGSIVLFFSVARSTGMAVVNTVSGGMTTGAVLYDRTERFARTLHPMLLRLRAITNGRGGAATAALAPAAPLTPHPCADGTGSVGVPADWTLRTAGGGSTAVVGPRGEIVAYNLAVSLQDPRNPRGLSALRFLPPQFQRMTVRLPYTPDPVQAWTTAFGQLARQNGNPPPAVGVTSVTRLQSGSGTNLARIIGTWTAVPSAVNPHGVDAKYLAIVQVLPANGIGQWTMVSTYILMPNAAFRGSVATAFAVLESVRVNFGAVAAQGAAIGGMFHPQFDRMTAPALAQDRARASASARFLAHDRAAQEGMHRQAVAMEHYVLDETTVVNTTTGRHSTIGSGFAAALVRDDRNYQTVPPSQLLRGIDY